MSEELVRETRERYEKAPSLSEQIRVGDYYIPRLCDALEEANERIRELEEQVRTYMEFPYTVPRQR